MQRNRIRPVAISLLLLSTCFALQPHAGNAAEADDADAAEISVEPVDLLSAEQLQDLVAPIALYPDELIAIVLPASTYPLQIVAAARHRELAESNPDIEPDETWDESVVALLNYPEALQLLNDDLDWTWSLGQAVTDQQQDVLTAITEFRTVAVEAGNLESDDRQEVVREDERIIVRSRDREVVYVPYYDPYDVTVRQTTRVYHYYPNPYPVYYYPYTYASPFYEQRLFWGVSSVFLLSWSDYHLYHYYHDHYRHPFYRKTYHRRHFRRTHHYHTPTARKHRLSRHLRHYNDRDRRRYQSAPWRPNHRFAGVRPGHRSERRYSSRQRDRAILKRGLAFRGEPGDRHYRNDRHNRHDKRLHTDKRRNLKKSLGSPDLHRDRRIAHGSPSDRPRSTAHRDYRNEYRQRPGRSAVHRTADPEANRARPGRDHFKPDNPSRNRAAPAERNANRSSVHRPVQRASTAQRPGREHFRPRNERPAADRGRRHQERPNPRASNPRQHRRQDMAAGASQPRRAQIARSAAPSAQRPARPNINKQVRQHKQAQRPPRNAQAKHSRAKNGSALRREPRHQRIR